MLDAIEIVGHETQTRRPLRGAVQAHPVARIGVDLAGRKLLERDLEIAAFVAFELGMLERAGEEVVAGIARADADAHPGLVGVARPT
jgi:hypothetical protein